MCLCARWQGTIPPQFWKKQILTLIFTSFIPIFFKSRLNEVCKQWESVVDNGPFWRHIFSRQFGIPLFLRLSWKQRTLACHRRAQIYELDLEGSIYGQLSWSAQYGYYQYFRNTIRKYSSSTRLPLKFDGDLVRFAASEGYCNVVESIMASHVRILSSHPSYVTPL